MKFIFLIIFPNNDLLIWKKNRISDIRKWILNSKIENGVKLIFHGFSEEQIILPKTCKTKYFDLTRENG